MSSTTTWILGIVAAGIVASGLIIWIVYSGGTDPLPLDTSSALGTGDNRTTAVPTTDQGGTSLPISGGISTQRIFKIADGPIAGATLIQTTRPTTTIARYVLQTNGHTFDLVLDSPGTIAKAISNTTIPGIAKVAWAPEGRAAVMQYMDLDTIKTASLGFRAAASTTTTPVRIQFLPANISSYAISPDGTQVVYLIKTALGADGYSARVDGSQPKKLFSLPLSHVSLTWPAQNTLLAHSNPAAGVAGIAFSINAQSGNAAPLLFAEGLSAIADRAFNRVIYQTAGSAFATYVYTISSGLATALPFEPVPERCQWSLATTTTLYCAAPPDATSASYPDLWRKGQASLADTIFSFDVTRGISTTIASPGSFDGGEESDILELVVSPDDSYLLFIRKGDRSLWGVRLTQPVQQ